MHLEPLKASGFSGDCNQRAGDVPLAMSQLTGHVDNLNRQMEILANRLESVLSAPEPIAGGADRSEVPHDPSCELGRSEEHTSELQSLMRIPYAVFCLKKKTEKENTR